MRARQDMQRAARVQGQGMSSAVRPDNSNSVRLTACHFSVHALSHHTPWFLVDVHLGCSWLRAGGFASRVVTQLRQDGELTAANP